MTSRHDVDGLQHLVHARCEACGLELDLDDLDAPSGRALGGADWLALVLMSAAQLGLVALAMSLDDLERMVASLGTELPRMTTLTIRGQLPVVFLLASGLAEIVGVWRRAKAQSWGAMLLWMGCAIAIAGAAICVWGLYLPLREMTAALSAPE